MHVSYGNVVRAKIVLVAAQGPGSDVIAACAAKAWHQASSFNSSGSVRPNRDALTSPDKSFHKEAETRRFASVSLEP